jgi:hypothetical protein
VARRVGAALRSLLKAGKVSASRARMERTVRHEKKKVKKREKEKRRHITVLLSH